MLQKCISTVTASELTLCRSQPLLLHIKHALDDQCWAYSFQDEAKSKSKGSRHPKQGYCKPAIKESFQDARHQKQPGCHPPHLLEDLHHGYSFPKGLHKQQAASKSLMGEVCLHALEACGYRLSHEHSLS